MDGRIRMEKFHWSQVLCSYMIDEASHFHLGKRTIRDSRQSQRVLEEGWMSWAGAPSEMILDCGGNSFLVSGRTSCRKKGSRPSSQLPRGSEERLRGMVIS